MKPRVSCNSFAWAAFALIGLAQPAFCQPATLTGQVTETLHGKPVPKVTLSFRRGMGRGTPPLVDVYSTQTDSQGRFRIENVIEGRYSVTFSAQGYSWPLRKDGSTEIPQPIALQPGEEHAVALQLTPTGVISGRTVDADGDPLRDVTVQALQYAYGNGKRVLIGSAGVQSNDRGEYRLYNLAPGSYYLQATVRNNMSGFVMNNEETRGPRPPQGFVSTYYPNVRDAASSAPLQVKPGEELSHTDIRLLPEMLYTVRVNLATPLAPDTFPMFFLQSRGERNGNVNSSGSYNGSAEFRSVLPGSYQLSGSIRSVGSNPEPQSYVRQMVEVVDHDVEIEAPAFTPVFDVTGSVQVDAAPPFPLQQLNLVLRSDYPDPYIQEPRATPAADGTFAFHGVVPDTYSLASMAMPAGAYLKSVKLGNRELRDLRLDISGGATPLTILLATDGARIRGSVENAAGEPAARIPVTLFPEGSRRDRQDRTKTAITDPNGRYEFKDIAPGDYRIFAWESAGLNASRDPDFRKQYEGQSVTVTATASGNMAVALKTVAAVGK